MRQVPTEVVIHEAGSTEVLQLYLLDHVFLSLYLNYEFLYHFVFFDLVQICSNIPRMIDMPYRVYASDQNSVLQRKKTDGGPYFFQVHFPLILMKLLLHKMLSHCSQASNFSGEQERHQIVVAFVLWLGFCYRKLSICFRLRNMYYQISLLFWLNFSNFKWTDGDH